MRTAEHGLPADHEGAQVCRSVPIVEAGEPLQAGPDDAEQVH